MAASASNQSYYDFEHSDTKVHKKMHNNISGVVYEIYICLGVCSCSFTVRFIVEMKKKNQNIEGIFQKMTPWVHMHFTKAFDVPLNDFNEYWEAAEQERAKKIDSGFKKEKGLFSCLPVWQ